MLKSYQSEGHLTVFANGHHKPVHRNNNAAHESGAPYKLPRSHASQDRVSSSKRQSVDSMASTKPTSPIKGNQPSTSKPISPSDEPLPAQSQRGSPPSGLSSNSQTMFGSRMSIDGAPYNLSEPSASVPSTMFHDFGFPSAESGLSIVTTSTEPAISGYSVPTSALDFDGNMHDFWANIDWGKLDTSNTDDAQPALTNASSGTISEIDDCPKMDDLSGFDLQYPIDGRAQMQPVDFGNEFSDGTSYGVFSGNYSSLDSGTSSNRWSMPTFSSRSATAMFSALSTNSVAKDAPSQATHVTNPSLQSQNMMASGSSSVQPHSPASDVKYQGKTDQVSSYDWNDLVPGYSGGRGSAGDESSLNFGMDECGSSTEAMTQGTDPTSDNNLEGFDQGFRTMQWNDGVSVPVDENYMGTFDFESNWAMNGFNNQWS